MLIRMNRAYLGPGQAARCMNSMLGLGISSQVVPTAATTNKPGRLALESA